MVWYVPPLSPIQSAAERGRVGMNGELPDVASLRIPVRYLANMLTAGDEAPVVRAMERMMAMRAWRRAINVDGVEDHAVLEQAGLTAAQAEARSEEHTSELQSLMRNSYAVLCLKKKT